MSQEMLLVMGHLSGSVETAPDHSMGRMVWERHRQGPHVPLAQQGPNREDRGQGGSKILSHSVALPSRERDKIYRGGYPEQGFTTVP